MQKQKLSKLFFLILAMILIVSVVFALKGEKKDRTQAMYNKISSAKEYTFTIEESSEIDYNLIVSKSENNRAIDMTSNSERTTTLVKDGYAYFILHNEEEYYIYPNDETDDIEADILEKGLGEIENKEYEKGKEKIYGKTYYYEEYEGVSSFIMLANSAEDETKVRTRFYFEGNNIAYIKTIIDEENQELLKVNCKYLADQSLFEIPANYAEI